MSKWQQVKLGDIVYIKTGKLDSNAAETNGIYPFFTCDPQTLRINTWAYDQEAVLLAGNNASGNYSAKYYRGRFNAYQRTYIISSKSDTILLNRFLAYALNLKLQYLKNISSGATTKFLTLSMLNNLSINLPPIEIQRKIADVLSAYDDLIENNRKQIKLLEEAAQRLYKEWFIDLRFPGHETTPIIDGIPEGWEKVQLCELIAFNPKITATNDTIKTFIPMEALSTSSMVISTAAVSETSKNAGSKFEIGDTLLARITPCLENGKTAFVSDIDKGVYGVGSTEFIVLRSKKLNPYIVYLLARTEEFRNYAINSMTGSDGRQRVKVDKLEMYSTLLPSRKIIDSFEQIVAPYFEKVKVLSKAVNSCQEARDYLLPKLMTGELEVK